MVIGALLGADEFGFSTTFGFYGMYNDEKMSLNAVCWNSNTNETLRKKFIGTGNVINYFFLVAEEVREIMASLGS